LPILVRLNKKLADRQSWKIPVDVLHEEGYTMFAEYSVLSSYFRCAGLENSESWSIKIAVRNYQNQLLYLEAVKSLSVIKKTKKRNPHKFRRNHACDLKLTVFVIFQIQTLKHIVEFKIHLHVLHIKLLTMTNVSKSLPT